MKTSAGHKMSIECETADGVAKGEVSRLRLDIPSPNFSCQRQERLAGEQRHQ